MALDRIWTLYASPEDATANRNGTPVWVQFDPRSSLVALPSVVLGDRNPVQTVTLRMRYRTDVTLRSVLTGEDDTWFVQQTLQVGRRHYLDVVVSAYGPAAEPGTPGTPAWPPAPPDGATQQAGYTLGYRELSVSSFDYVQRGSNRNTGLDLWVGVRCTNPDDRSGVVPNRLIIGARNTSGGDVWFDCRVSRNSPGNLNAPDGFRVQAADSVFPNNESVSVTSRWWRFIAYANQSPTLAVGQRVYVLTQEEVTALPRGSI